MTAPICAASFAGTEPVEPRHQRGVQSSRGPPAQGRNGGGRPLALRLLPASSTALVISSTKRGIPSVRSIISCRTLVGSGLLPTITVDHGNDFPLIEPVERERRDVRSSNPRRLKFRSVVTISNTPGFLSGPRFDRERPSSWVNPMSVLEDHQHWLLVR